MAGVAKSSRENGKKGGRPKGSTTKPRLSDYLTAEDVKSLVAKALDLAKAGSPDMLKFILDHNFGKAPQSIDHTSGGEKLPTPMYAGNAK